MGNSRDDGAGEDEQVSEEVDSRSKPPLVADREVVGSVLEVDHFGVVCEEARDLPVGSNSAETGERLSKVCICVEKRVRVSRENERVERPQRKDASSSTTHRSNFEEWNRSS